MKVPPSAPQQPAGSRRSVLGTAFGLLLIGIGRPVGFTRFGATASAYLGSLAPLLGFVIVLTALLALTGHFMVAAGFCLSMLCNLLAPVVIAELFCGLWKRQLNWALYANVLNCAQWLMLMALLVFVAVASLALSLGVPVLVTRGVMRLGFGLYVLWFQWFVARHALNLSRARALLVMLGVVGGTILLAQGPALLVGRDISGGIDQVSK